MNTRQSGVFHGAHLILDLALIILVVSNIFFGIQYLQNVKQQAANLKAQKDVTATRVQIANFLKLYSDVVLNTQGTISYDNRIKLENDVIQLKDTEITAQWNAIVNAKNVKTAQTNAAKLISILANKML